MNYMHPSFTERAKREEVFCCGEDLKSIELSPGERFQIDYTHRLLRINAKYPRFYRFSEVKSASLRIDEVNSSGKSTSSVLGRAALFGLVTGGAGAIVGALTAKTVQKREVKRVALAVTVDGWEFELKHYLYSSGYFKGYHAEEAIEVGQRVRDKLLESGSPLAAADPDALAKNLASLSELHERGLLSAEEFTAAKHRLLS